MSLPTDAPRCHWARLAPDDYRHYHDTEWGRPVADDRRLFEKLCLEGFQSGLSWLTILRKREAFRAAFDGFDIAAIAGDLGYAPTTSIEVGVPNFVRWYRDYHGV